MTKTNPVLKAELRTVTGKKVKSLRNKGILPSSIYGHGFEPISIQVVDKEIESIFAHVGESGLVDLMLDDKKIPVLFRNPQYHPVVGGLIHVDCYKVNLKEKITTTVPLIFINESPAVKAGNVLVEVANEIEVEALPTDLPEHIEVDLGKLETLESMITVADLIVDKAKVEIKTEADQVVVKVEEPRVEEVAPVEESTEPVVAPAMNQKSEEEKAAEGEDKKKEEK